MGLGLKLDLCRKHISSSNVHMYICTFLPYVYDESDISFHVMNLS